MLAESRLQLEEYFAGRRTTFGMPLDSTLFVSRMIFGGVLERFWDLKICIVHGGGYIPFYPARFDQGAFALAVYLRDRYVGYVWLAFRQYDEDELRCRFALSRPEQTAFDFDVYVFPAFRLGRAFAAVWHAANSHLAERGVTRTCSRIASAA